MGLRLDFKFGFSRLLSFKQLSKGADVKVDLGGGDNITAKHTAPAGDDSQPLPGDRPMLVPGAAEGSQNVGGYVDDKNPLIAAAGEKRLYSRDADGNIKAVFWLKNDGQVILMNDLGMLVIGTDGTITANGATIDVAGNIICTTLTTTGITVTGVAGTVSAAVMSITTSLVAAGKQLVGHSHAQGNDSAGNSQVNTGSNL